MPASLSKLWILASFGFILPLCAGEARKLNLIGTALNIGNHTPSDFSIKNQTREADGLMHRAFGSESKARSPYLVKPDQIEVQGRVFATYELLPAKPGASSKP